MSWLSKQTKSLTGGVQSILNPVNDIFSAITGIGGKPGVQNPFGVPDLSFLKNPVDLTKNFKPIESTDPLFQQLIGKINAPSSVDEVQSRVNGDMMQQLLDQINQDTTNQVGSLKSDFLDRGLGGPNQISDIEAQGLGDLRGNAIKASAGARLGFANQELAMQKAKEDAATAAYRSQYDTGNKNATQNAQTYNDLLKGGASLTADQQATFAKLISDLYSGGAKNNIDTQQPGYLDTILRNIKVGLNVGGH